MEDIEKRLIKVMKKIKARCDSVDTDSIQFEKGGDQWWYARGGMSAYSEANTELMKEFQDVLPVEIPGGWLKVGTVGPDMCLGEPYLDVQIIKAWADGPGAVCVRLDSKKLPPSILLRSLDSDHEPTVIPLSEK